MNYLQNKQKAKWPIVLVDIKHSHFYNGKLYFFLTFPFFGSKIQHFSTFGLNQDDQSNWYLNQENKDAKHDNTRLGTAHPQLVLVIIFLNCSMTLLLTCHDIIVAINTTLRINFALVFLMSKLDMQSNPTAEKPLTRSNIVVECTRRNLSEQLWHCCGGVGSEGAHGRSGVLVMGLSVVTVHNAWKMGLMGTNVKLYH